LSNPSNNSSLYFAVAKYLCILSNVKRDYPPSNKLRAMASRVRLEVATFMLKNRYMCVNVLGTIEKNTGYVSWMARKNNDFGIPNHEVFNLLLNNLHIKHNQSVFRNPTSYSIDDLIDMFESESSQLDNFTKYCILMAQNLGPTQAFKTDDDTLVTLEFNTGISEVISLALLLKRSIVCLSSDKMDDDHYKYIVGNDNSYYVTKKHMPILLHFREHYDIIWPEFHGRPVGVKHPPKLRDEGPPFKYTATHSERLDPISVDTPEIPLELESFNLNGYLRETFVSSVVEPLVPYLKSQWDIDGTLPVEREVLADINPDDLFISEPHKADKKIFVPADLIQIGNFNYTIKYITKDTPIISKGFITQPELQELLNDINSKKHLDKSKPIKIIAQKTITGKHTYRHHNFMKNAEDRDLLKKLLMNKEIIVIKPSHDNQIIGADTIKQNINLRCQKHVLYGNYYYKCSYLSPPLVHKYKIPTKKHILRELKQSRLVKYQRPIKIIENWDDVCPHISYGIFINGEEDDDIELQQHIDNGNIKVLEPLNIIKPKYVKEDEASRTCDVEATEDNSIDIRSNEPESTDDDDDDEDDEDGDILIQPDDIIENCDARDKEAEIKVIRFGDENMDRHPNRFRDIRQRKVINDADGGEDTNDADDADDGEYEDTNITPNILHSASYFNSKTTSNSPMKYTKRRPVVMGTFHSSKASKGDVLNVIVNDDVSEEFLLPVRKKINKNNKNKTRTKKNKSVKKHRTPPQTKKIIRSKGRKNRIKKSAQKKVKTKSK